MYDKHLKLIKSKLIRNSVIYAVLLVMCILLAAYYANIFAYGITAIVIYFYTGVFLKYYMYLRWVKKFSDREVAIIKFKSQPHLFLKRYNGFKLPLKEFCLPVEENIEIIVLDALKEIKSVIHTDYAANFDLIVGQTNEIHLEELREEI